MTNLLARILLAMVMFPLAIMLFFVAFVILENQLRDFYALVWATVLVGFCVTLYWLALWRPSVRWTRGRILGTVVAGPGCLIGGGVIGLLVTAGMGYVDEEFAVFFGGILAILLWLAVTVLIWRETPKERTQRVQQAAGEVLFCPQCGYNMTGLYESRCPECGGRWSLDQLYGAQRQGQIVDTATGEADPGD